VERSIFNNNWLQIYCQVCEWKNSEKRILKNWVSSCVTKTFYHIFGPSCITCTMKFTHITPVLSVTITHMKRWKTVLLGLHWIGPDFSSGSGKSEIRPYFGNPTKSGSGQISSRICQTPAQLQYNTDKTNAADLSRGVFAILISVTRTKNTKFITIPQISSKSGKHRCNKRTTELYCCFIAADSTDDAIIFIRRIVLWSEKRVVLESRSGSGRI